MNRQKNNVFLKFIFTFFSKKKYLIKSKEKTKNSKIVSIDNPNNSTFKSNYLLSNDKLGTAVKS